MADTGGNTRLAEERGNKFRKQSVTELLRNPSSETRNKKWRTHAVTAVNIVITTTMYRLATM